MLKEHLQTLSESKFEPTSETTSVNDVAIRVEGLGKKYKIGVGRRRIKSTLSESLNNALLSLVRGLRYGLIRAQVNNEPVNQAIHWALKDISFELKSGQVLGIVGHNGSGKSTLMKILSRITHPTTGSFEMYGRLGALLEVGTGFHPELTGRENVFLNGSILGMTRHEIESKFDQIVGFSEIEEFIDTPVKHYSSGMYVRLAFSVAAHLDADILLLDEVLAVGDITFRKKSKDKMKSIALDGRTVVLVSHDSTAIREICRTVMWLNRGEIKMWGDTAEVMDAYEAFSAQPPALRK